MATAPKLPDHPHVVLVKRVMLPRERGTPGFVVAAFGPFQNAHVADAAILQVKHEHPRFTDPQYETFASPLLALKGR